MVPVIALTQFAFAALGSIAVIVLSRAQTVPAGGGALRNFLITNTLWMLLVPLLWLIVAQAVMMQATKPWLAGTVCGVGVTLTVLIVAIYGWLILSF